MDEICEPILNKTNSATQYLMIPRYLELSLSSISFSANIDCLENDLLGAKSNGLDSYRYLGAYASTIGYCLEMWGVRQSLLYKLIVGIKGQQNLSGTPWTRSICIPLSPNNINNLSINSIDPLWFEKPLLAMNLIDAITLFVVTSKYNNFPPFKGNPLNQNDLLNLRRQNDTSAIKWICVAYLVQCFVHHFLEIENENLKLGKLLSYLILITHYLHHNFF